MEWRVHKMLNFKTSIFFNFDCFRCRVDFQDAQTRNSFVNVNVIGTQFKDILWSINFTLNFVQYCRTQCTSSMSWAPRKTALLDPTGKIYHSNHWMVYSQNDSLYEVLNLSFDSHAFTSKHHLFLELELRLKFCNKNNFDFEELFNIHALIL